MLLSGDRSTAVLLRRFASLYDAPSPSFGKARVFYPDATSDKCSACLLLEIDPVDLVRGTAS
jgi:hypothetical protein